MTLPPSFVQPTLLLPSRSTLPPKGNMVPTSCSPSVRVLCSLSPPLSLCIPLWLVTRRYCLYLPLSHPIHPPKPRSTARTFASVPARECASRRPLVVRAPDPRCVTNGDLPVQVMSLKSNYSLATVRGTYKRFKGQHGKFVSYKKDLESQFLRVPGAFDLLSQKVVILCDPHRILVDPRITRDPRAPLLSLKGT